MREQAALRRSDMTSAFTPLNDHASAYTGGTDKYNEGRVLIPEDPNSVRRKYVEPHLFYPTTPRPQYYPSRLLAPTDRVSSRMNLDPRPCSQIPRKVSWGSVHDAATSSPNNCADDETSWYGSMNGSCPQLPDLDEDGRKPFPKPLEMRRKSADESWPRSIGFPTFDDFM